MDRAQRKSERLAEKRRRAGRRSHDISVGEALDADTHEVDATNLTEARAMGKTNPAGQKQTREEETFTEQQTQDEETVKQAKQATPPRTREKPAGIQRGTTDGPAHK